MIVDGLFFWIHQESRQILCLGLKYLPVDYFFVILESAFQWQNGRGDRSEISIL